MNSYGSSSTHRLRRIEGQISGVLAMMEQDRSCSDVVMQLSAVRAAVDRLILQVVGMKMEQCIRTDVESGQSIEEALEEAMQLLIKSR